MYGTQFSQSIYFLSNVDTDPFQISHFRLVGYFLLIIAAL